MILESITIEGFGSIVKPTTYKLNRPGINLLLGHNGSGKSTIVTALAWAIYGKVIGKDGIETWEDFQPKNYSGVKVDVGFVIKNRTYLLTRCQNYTGKILKAKGANRLILLRDGKQNNKLRNKGDIQKYLLDLIGFSFDVFCNSIVLGQNITRILDEKGERQKSIMDEAFSTLYIEKGRARAKADLEIVKTSINEINNKVTKYELLVENNLSAINHLKVALTGIEGRIGNLRGDIQRNKERLNKLAELKEAKELHTLKKLDLEKQLKFLLPTIDAYGKAQKDYFKLDSLEIPQLEGQYADYRKVINEYKSKMGAKTCHACGQLIKNNTHKDHIIKAISEVKKKLAKLEADLAIKKAELEVVIKLVKSLREDNQKVKDLQSKLQKVTNELIADPKYNYSENLKDDILNEIKSLEKSLDTAIRVDRDSLRESVEIHQSKVDEFNKVLTEERYKLAKFQKEYNNLHWLINHALSNKGLKSYIFNRMLEQINHRSKYYEAFCGFSVNLSIDLESKTKPLKALIYKGNKLRPYKALSGGEKQLANNCTSFAIHDVVTSSKSINVLFTDEIFENLDKANIQVIAELLADRARTQSVHIITHRSEFTSYNAHITELRLNSKNHTEVMQ